MPFMTPDTSPPHLAEDLLLPLRKAAENARSACMGVGFLIRHAPGVLHAAHCELAIHQAAQLPGWHPAKPGSVVQALCLLSGRASFRLPPQHASSDNAPSEKCCCS